MTSDKESKIPQHVLDAINGFGPTSATSAWIRDRLCEVARREPELPRINAAAVVADVQGELVPDNDETRPLTIDSFGGDFGEQLKDCISRPLPALRKRQAIPDNESPGEIIPIFSSRKHLLSRLQNSVLPQAIPDNTDPDDDS